MVIYKTCNRCKNKKDIEDFPKAFIKKWNRYQYGAKCQDCEVEIYHEEALEKRIKNRKHILNLVDEVWKPIMGYEGYEVSNKGRVKSLERSIFDSNNKKKTILGTLFIPQNTGNGYLQVSLSTRGNKKIIHIHRLVAQAFIPNPENKCCVNHKDGNKCNNHSTNLEYVSSKENTAHAVRMGLMNNLGSKNGHAKQVVQISLDGFIVGVYDSHIEASKETGVPFKSISAVQRNKQKTAWGHIWK